MSKKYKSLSEAIISNRFARQKDIKKFEKWLERRILNAYPSADATRYVSILSSPLFETKTKNFGVLESNLRFVEDAKMLYECLLQFKEPKLFKTENKGIYIGSTDLKNHIARYGKDHSITHETIDNLIDFLSSTINKYNVDSIKSELAKKPHGNTKFVCDLCRKLNYRMINIEPKVASRAKFVKLIVKKANELHLINTEVPKIKTIESLINESMLK